MFEFLMLIGFLGAGLCHWQPRAESESAEPEERDKKDGEAKVKERRQGRKALRARISAA
jgi:hypothetical protein